jgi:hypothetical protein
VSGLAAMLMQQGITDPAAVEAASNISQQTSGQQAGTICSASG